MAKKWAGKAHASAEMMQQGNWNKEQMTEMIKKRAFELSQKRGGSPGQEWNDWFEAENQVRQELQQSNR